tara:strand:+ start:387 stop:962 length:576 start_codon:yes stop_codon:yes gene_type:complete
MKKIIQLFLLSILILISIFFYNKYFFSSKTQKIKVIKQNDQSSLEDQNNLIKNLKYNVKFDNNTEYFITADFSELTEDEGDEIVKMQVVLASFIDENSVPLKISSDSAIYNNSTYDTKFEKNVMIEYKENIIKSENLDLDFSENIVTIYGNVIYEGNQGKIFTDNVVINLLKKNIEIFMDNTNKKVNILSN